MAGPPNGHQGHICVKCAGEFAIGLVEPGTVHVDYVFVQPGKWGRYADGPFLKDGVEVLKTMGISSIRLGGSFTDPSYYFWKYWTGDPWERKSLGAKWGSELISGFGPFEFIDMCAEAGIEPIVTTTAQWGDEMGRSNNVTCCSPSDMADLIEYTWGDDTTAMGKARIADGHSEPYRVKYFELGNEQDNTLFSDQVKAMEERATKLGKAKFFYYMSPNNAKWLSPADADAVEALGLGTHVVADMHVGAGGGVDVAQSLFSRFPGKTMGAVNAETNDGTHTMTRAAKEAADLNAWFNCYDVDGTGEFCSRLKFRTASFCNERSGHFDAFDQGISFFLPNMTWIQPPGYVHVMHTTTWQPNGLRTTISGGDDSRKCKFYAYWADHGCRTWESCGDRTSANCDPAKVKACPLLYKRTGNSTFVGDGDGFYCNDPTIFMDGPGATASDAACEQKCVTGTSNSGAAFSVSAQQSNDKSQVVIHIANTNADTPQTIQLKLAGGLELADYGGSADLWTLTSADPMAANTPSNPTAVSPVKTTIDSSDLKRPITVRPLSVTAIVLSK